MSTLVKVGEEKVVLKQDDSQGQKKQTFVSEEGMYRVIEVLQSSVMTFNGLRF